MERDTWYLSYLSFLSFWSLADNVESFATARDALFHRERPMEHLDGRFADS